MKSLFKEFGIDISDEKLSKLKDFGEILKEYNKFMNLTTVTGDEEMWIKHFLDSVAGESFFNYGCKVCEVGSGGGFPSIPLKILREDLSFTLIESTGKKCDYLKAVVKELKLENIEVICARAEDVAKQKTYREGYGAVTARAVAAMNTLAEYCLPFVEVGGRFIAYKGDAAEELKNAQNAIKVLGGEIENVMNFELPNGYGKRNIIVVKKIKNTPQDYPRGNGKERKKPL